MQAASVTHHPRSADRFGLVLPITLGGEEGSTHDVSATGVLLELRAAPPLGSHVALTLRYEAGGCEHQLACRGEVIRVEPHGDSFNIALRLSEPLFNERRVAQRYGLTRL